MDSQKQSSNSNTSSPESDHQSKKSPEDTTGVGRSYECTFCKRGFTNAQALGGHMNIHRKDKAKAKAKQKNQESIKMNESYANSGYFPLQITSNDHQQQQTSYYGAAHVNYQVYLPSSNPNFQTVNNYQNNLPVWMSGLYNDRVDENLSLRIGLTPHVEDEEEDKNVKENEVDLELRLGHDP
ncbi:hypothetical protein BUALT_Bualt14G0109000 [Buddleja alternifolia]|uniref:C2H2-type domain-containing protein n=1 Tax=Buddleja alternifolia TaxID=168488 RepID=A0AAV6WPL3_9LAMI|nr:hypothetical protein BUALT_Bualt14G0109000 [Buddleja alternifolia]